MMLLFNKSSKRALYLINNVALKQELNKSTLSDKQCCSWTRAQQEHFIWLTMLLLNKSSTRALYLIKNVALEQELNKSTLSD